MSIARSVRCAKLGVAFEPGQCDHSTCRQPYRCCPFGPPIPMLVWMSRTTSSPGATLHHSPSLASPLIQWSEGTSSLARPLARIQSGIRVHGRARGKAGIGVHASALHVSLHVSSGEAVARSDGTAYRSASQKTLGIDSAFINDCLCLEHFTIGCSGIHTPFSRLESSS